MFYFYSYGTYVCIYPKYSEEKSLKILSGLLAAFLFVEKETDTTDKELDAIEKTFFERFTEYQTLHGELINDHSLPLKLSGALTKHILGSELRNDFALAILFHGLDSLMTCQSKLIDSIESLPYPTI